MFKWTVCVIFIWPLPYLCIWAREWMRHFFSIIKFFNCGFSKNFFCELVLQTKRKIVKIVYLYLHLHSKQRYLSHCYSDKGWKGRVVNGKCRFIIWGLLENTYRVPLFLCIFLCIFNKSANHTSALVNSISKINTIVK